MTARRVAAPWADGADRARVPIRVRGRVYVVELAHEGDQLVGRVHIPTPIGTVTVSAAAPYEGVRRLLIRASRSAQFRRVKEVLAVGGDDLEVAGVFDDIGEFFTKTIPRAAKKVTRSSVFRDIAKGIGAVTDHPAFNVAMGVVNVIPGYGQAISAGMAGLKVAAGGMNLLARAKAKEPKAQNAIRQIAAAAKRGNPKAIAAMARLKAMNENPKLRSGQPAPNLGSILQGLGGAKPSGGGGGVDQAAFRAVEGMMPGFADAEQYQALKGLYGVGKGIADIATQGGASAAMSSLGSLFGDDADVYEVGADGAWRPRARRTSRVSYGVGPVFAWR